MYYLGRLALTLIGTPRQSKRIAGACCMYEWLFGKILQDSIYVEIDNCFGSFF